MSDKINRERLRALKNEVKMAEALNKEELYPIINESLHRYIGDFLPRYGVNWDIVLNEVYPVVQNNLPAIFFRNPRAFLKPRNKTFIAKVTDPRTGKKVEQQLDSGKSARTQEDILNYTVLEIDYKREARRVLLDALLFPYGVLWHGYKGDFGMTEEQSIFIKDEKVFVKRLSPLKYIHDPKVTISNIEEAQWVGRAIDIPFRELVEDEKLDVDKAMVKGYKGFGTKVGTASENELREKAKSQGGKDYMQISPTRKSLLDYTDKTFQDSIDSRFVRIYEIFLRPTKKEKRDGSKGWILLITDEQEKPLRQSPWTIKAEGFPSQILEFNELPDNLFGISDVDIYKGEADQKNIIINMQIRNAQETNKTWVGISKEGGDEEAIQKAQQGENTILVYEAGSPRDKMFVASAGGQASSELYLLDGRIQRSLEDKSGVTDLRRGYLQSGEESAASVKIRNAGGAARPAYRQDIMSDFLKKSFHYINQLNKQFIPYEDAVRIVGSLDLQWSEKPSKETIQADTDVEIDVYSMLPENPQKELQELNTMLVLMFQALTTPQVFQKLQQEGKTINISPLIEQMLLRMRLKDPEIFRSIKPEESMGYLSTQQTKEAQQNVSAALTNKPPPFPPKEGDDHKAKLEVYLMVQGLLKAIGQVSDVLEQIIQIQQALMQKEQESEAKPNMELPKPKISTVGE